MTDPLRLAQQLRDESVPLVVERVERGTLHATVSGVRMSLLEYRYPLLRRLVLWPATRVRLASLEDIACMKLAAVAQRGARKDFVDIYALGRRIPLRQMLTLYRRKYRIQDHGHVLFALTYFDDAEREPMPRVLKSPPWPEIKNAIRGWVAELAR